MIKNNNPKISVVMSTYNAERYLAEAIESILNQTFKDFEFIIINDGSTDDSSKIIKNYAKKDKRIVVINNKENIGLIKSLNKGIKRAIGKYIARMDADDISMPNRFQVQFDFLEKNQDIFLVGTRAFLIDDSGKRLGKTHVKNDFKIIRKILESGNNCFIHSSIMFRKGSDVRYREKAMHCEDYDLYLQLLLKRKKFSNIDMPLLEYRISSNSVISKNYFYAKLFLDKMKKIYIKQLREGMDDYPQFNPNEILNVKFPEGSALDYQKRLIRIIFELDNKELLRNFCMKYFRKKGFFNDVFIFYLISFFPSILIKKMLVLKKLVK